MPLYCYNANDEILSVQKIWVRGYGVSDGCYDMVHFGHANSLHYGSSFCSFLIKIWKFQFGLVNNCSNIEGKIFPSHICRKWGIYWQKTWTGCRINFKFCAQQNYPVPGKKPQNNFLYRTPFIVKMGSRSENWNFRDFFQFLLKGFKQNSMN